MTDARDKQINSRVSAKEAKRIEALAKRAGLTKSDYIRMAALAEEKCPLCGKPK